MYACVSYNESGLFVATNDSLPGLMDDLLESVYMGQDGYIYGVPFRPTTFHDEVKLLAKDMPDSDYQELAEAIMALIDIRPIANRDQDSWIFTLPDDE